LKSASGTLQLNLAENDSFYKKRIITGKQLK
jgi:hypothetical protein